ncbi:MAG: IclR family transcriptional regulator [Thermodesulfobacteriota bacterium]
MKFNTLAKAIEIFDLFLDKRDSLDVYEIAKSLHMPKSTAYAYLAFLKDNRFLDAADKPGKYKLGLRFLDYASIIRNQLDLTSVALPHMRELSKLLRSTIILTVHRGEYSYIVGKVEHDVGLVYIRNIGDRMPLYSGASSKIHLAYMKDSEIDQYLRNTELKKLSKHTITSRDKLIEDLRKIRRLGYAFSNQEIDIGVCGAAAPILNGEGGVVASICVVGPVNKINKKNLETIAGAVINCARAVSREMEYERGI